MSNPKIQLISDAKNSIERMQTFDPSSIARTDELGKSLNFADAVPDAQRVIDLFKQIAIDVLPEFSTQLLTKLKQVADGEYNRLNQMLTFSNHEGNPKQTRDGLVANLQQGYDNVFDQLWPAIAYSVRRATDFARLETEARAAVQSIDDRTKAIEADLVDRSKEAEKALDAIRKVAAEQGVSQQAIYFREEADHHTQQAAAWLKTTGRLSAFIVVCAFGSMFLHKIPFLVPTDPYQAFQLAISKFLIFGGMGYYLVLSGRNFLAHRHNAVVNRHRQNSLVTFKALVEAAGDQANHDIILTKAADTIFSAQPTGFSKTDGDDGKAVTLLNISPPALKAPT